MKRSLLYIFIGIVLVIILALVFILLKNRQDQPLGDSLPEEVSRQIDNLPSADPGEFPGESIVLSDGQTICDFYRSGLKEHPGNETFQKDYEDAITQKFCNPTRSNLDIELIKKHVFLCNEQIKPELESFERSYKGGGNAGIAEPERIFYVCLATKMLVTDEVRIYIQAHSNSATPPYLQ